MHSGLVFEEVVGGNIRETGLEGSRRSGGASQPLGQLNGVRFKLSLHGPQTVGRATHHDAPVEQS